MRALVIAALVGLLILGGEASPIATAQGTPSISITKPSAAGDLIAEGDDFATTVIGNAWDMSETVPPDVESYLNLTASTVSYSNGIFHGVARTNDPELWLLSWGFGQNDPCCAGSLHWKPNDGYINPIDADKYRFATFRMRLDGADPNLSEGQFFWYRTDSPFDPTEVSVPFRTFNGWRTYTIDLKTVGALAGSWSGTVRGFRFDPSNTSGATVEIDYIRLVADPTPASTHTVQWQTANAPAGSLVDLYCAEGGTVVCTIGQNIQATRGSFDWSTHLLDPGAYTIQARMGADFAGLRLDNPWDMTSAADSSLFQLTGSFGQSISNRLTGFSGFSTGDDPQFLLNVPTPIDASIFKHLTFNLRVNTSDAVARQVIVYWLANGQWHGTDVVAVGSDMQQLTWDMSRFANWTGQVSAIRIDPAARLANGAGQVPIELGPVTLTTSGTDARVFLATSPGPLTINTSPQVQITAPSRTSGPDFATTVLSDPWDMSDPEDIQRVGNSSFNLANGFASGVSTFPPGGDPQIELNTRGQRIDTTKYRYLTYRYRLDDSMHPPDKQAREWLLKMGEGWAARVLWWGPGGPGTDHCTSTWAVTEAYEFTYTIDLGTVPLETGTWMGQAACAPQGRPWLQANVTQFRFDPHEVPPSTGWVLDYLLITGNQEAVNTMNIRWNAQDPDPNQSAVVDLFFSPVNTGASLTPIATVAADRGSYAWNISTLARGSYYVIARIRDSFNTTQRVSAAPFVAVAPPTACSPRPRVNVQTGPSGDGRLRVTIEATGAGNEVQSIRFDPTNNALIDVPGGPTGSKGDFIRQVGATSRFEFFLRREIGGQPATSNFTVVDNCGDWPSLAGGGVAAPF